MYLSVAGIGVVIWTAAIILLRVFGDRILTSNNSEMALLFIVSFPLCIVVGRALYSILRMPSSDPLRFAISLLFPTLLFDPLVTLNFERVFPNMSNDLAGAFGALMLWCVGGALLGITSVRAARDVKTKAA